MKSKTAFITGASRGIGRAIAEEFAKAGYRLALNCRASGQELYSFARELHHTYHVPCLPMVGDVSDEAFVKQAFQTAARELGKTETAMPLGASSFARALVKELTPPLEAE